MSDVIQILSGQIESFEATIREKNTMLETYARDSQAKLTFETEHKNEQLSAMRSRHQEEIDNLRRRQQTQANELTQHYNARIEAAKSNPMIASLTTEVNDLKSKVKTLKEAVVKLGGVASTDDVQPKAKASGSVDDPSKPMTRAQTERLDAQIVMYLSKAENTRGVMHNDLAARMQRDGFIPAGKNAASVLSNVCNRLAGEGLIKKERVKGNTLYTIDHNGSEYLLTRQTIFAILKQSALRGLPMTANQVLAEVRKRGIDMNAIRLNSFFNTMGENLLVDYAKNQDGSKRTVYSVVV